MAGHAPATGSSRRSGPGSSAWPKPRSVRRPTCFGPKGFSPETPAAAPASPGRPRQSLAALIGSAAPSKAWPPSAPPRWPPMCPRWTPLWPPWSSRPASRTLKAASTATSSSISPWLRLLKTHFCLTCSASRSGRGLASFRCGCLPSSRPHTVSRSPFPPPGDVFPLKDGNPAPGLWPRPTRCAIRRAGSAAMPGVARRGLAVRPDAGSNRWGRRWGGAGATQPRVEEHRADTR